jgi:ABC-type branched-subunit amino acid transport system substrate-binding protein
LKRLSTLAAIGITAATVAALASCSNDHSGGPAAATTGAGVGKSGDTIKLMVIGELSSPILAFPELVSGAQVAVNEVNAAGGVNGHKIALLSCNAQTDPNVAASCARKAVSEKVSAVVGMLSLEGDAVMRVLAAAKIPTIASTANSPLDYTSPTSFPIISGPVAIVGQVMTMPGYQDCKHPAVLVLNQPTSQDGAQRIKKLYAKLNIDTKIVDVNMQSTDVRPQVATLLSGGTDCVFPVVTPQIGIGLLKTIADSGQHVKVSQLISATPVESLRQLGAAAQGMYAASPFKIPGATAVGTKFASVLAAVDTKAAQDEQAEEAYTGVLIFAHVAKSLTDFSAPKVLDALNNAKNIDVGTIAPIPSYPADSGIPGLARINVTNLYSYVFEGNDFKLVSPNPVDITTGLS